MKHTKKKRILALVLCMVLVLSTGIAAFANENVGLQSVACSATSMTRVIKNANGEQIGTLTADVPEGAFFANSSDANIQMEVEPDSGEAGVLNRVQQQMEAEGVTGYEINNYVMTNVTFYVNGEKQTPQQPITFHVSGTNVDTQNVMAFADDRQNAPTLMDATTDENGGLQFTAQTSGAEKVVYGVYDVTASDVATQESDDGVAVMAVNGPSYIVAADTDVSVKVMYYQNDKKIFADHTYTLAANEQINLATEKSANYQLQAIYKADENGNKIGDALTLKNDGTIAETLNANATYRVDYTTTTESNVSGDVTFYDYQINPSSGESINDASNYGGTSSSPRFAMGGEDHYRKDNEHYSALKSYSGLDEAVDINEWAKARDNYIYKDIITGVNVQSGALIMGKDSSNQQIYEPGLFTTDNAGEGTGKQIYTDRTLKFSRDGNTYTLTGVMKGQEAVVSDVHSFFPLDEYKGKEKTMTFDGTQNNEAYRDGNHNYYFGMRYDIQFELKDYIGDLNYSFTGDDDMWVVMDGNRVVVDVGGIHAAMPGTIDLWTVLLDKTTYIDADKEAYVAEHGNEQHRLTVLYLERGGYLSNCEMTYTLPNSMIITPSTIPTAELKLTKVNTSGATIENAEFKLVNDDNSSDVRTTISDASGNVSFTGLKAGNYTLTEESVPDPYAVSKTSWKVTVTVSGETATATLYDTSGTEATEVEKVNGRYKIINYTKEEELKLSLNYDKTAHVTNWDERKYEINITASSKLTSTTTEESGGTADVMLVLDASGSMGDTLNYNLVGNNTSEVRNKLNTQKTYYLKIGDSYYEMTYSRGSGGGPYGGSAGWKIYGRDASNYRESYQIYEATTRMDALKAAAAQFIAKTAEKSPNSKVGVSVFSSIGYGNHGNSKELQEVGTNKDTLTSFVNGLSANGGTDPAVGLNDAYAKLQAAKVAGDELPKYVILFTDGAPTGARKDKMWDPTAKANAETAAQKLKDMGVTVYTIGFSLDDKAKTFLEGGTYGGTTYPGIASPGCAKTADDANSLLDIFNKISNTITNNLDISGAKIVDVIDPRFVILDEKGNQITKAYIEDKRQVDENGIKYVTLENGGKVYYQGDKQYIEWTDQTITNETKGTWSKTIPVQAQDDYIGGNDVPTNVAPDSKIITSYGEGVLPQPKVNVKADLKLNDKEITIYKGDNVPTADDVLKDMIQNYTANTGKYGVKSNQFEAKWYSEAALKSNPNFADGTGTTAEIVGTKVINDTTYYLKVTYNAGKPSTESNANTTLNGNIKIAGGDTHKVEATTQATQTTQSRKYGTYKIHVISGTIKIIKKLEEPLKSDQTFEFVVKNADGNEVAKVPITIENGKDEGTVDEAVLAKLTNLPRGTYTLIFDS